MLLDRIARYRLPLASLSALLLLLLSGSADAGNVGVNMNLGDTAYSTIDPEGDEDPFVFDAAEGGTFAATVKRTKGSVLEPMLRLVSPDGEEIAIEDALKFNEKSAKLKKIVLTRTGRYAVVVHGVNGTTGDYMLKIKGKPPKKTVDKGSVIQPGEQVDYVFGGVVDAVITLKLLIKTTGASLEILDFLDPTGTPVTGWQQYILVTKKGNKAKMPLTGLFDGIGEYVLTLGNASVETEYNFIFKLKFPKAPKEKRYVPAEEPRIDSVGSTTSGQPFGVEGTEVAIDGEHFAAFPEEVKVWFGDSPVTSFLLRREDRIVVRVPAGEGEVDVHVQNPDGNVGTAEKAFTYVADPPSPLGLSTYRMPGAGGVVVTVTGNNLEFAEKARIGFPRPDESNVVPVQVVSDQQITFTSPPFSPADQDVPLTIIDWFGQESPTITVRVVGAPQVAAVDPAGGSFAGGNRVTVQGGNLDEENEYVVFLDGADVSATFADPGWTFTAAAHAMGMVDVLVRDKWGQETTVVDGYEYNDGAFINETSDRLPEVTAGFSMRGLGMVFADVDADDDEDIVICSETPTSQFEKLTKLLLNDGSGSFTDASQTNLPALATEYGDSLHGSAIAIGDLDGDNDPDLVIASDTVFVNPNKVGHGSAEFINTPYPSTRVLLNDGKGKFTLGDTALPTVIPTNKVGTDTLQANAVALGDIDGDDDLDLVIARRQEPAVSILLYVSGYSWYGYKYTFATRYPPDEGTAVIPATRVFTNNGAGTFASASVVPATTDGDIFAADAILLGDVDGDDDLDLVVTVESDECRTPGNTEYVNAYRTGSFSKTRILRNSGGSFSNATSDLMPDPSSTLEDFSGLGLALGDLDGDGNADLVVTTNREI